MSHFSRPRRCKHAKPDSSVSHKCSSCLLRFPTQRALSCHMARNLERCPQPLVIPPPPNTDTTQQVNSHFVKGFAQRSKSAPLVKGTTLPAESYSDDESMDEEHVENFDDGGSNATSDKFPHDATDDDEEDSSKASKSSVEDLERDAEDNPELLSSDEEDDGFMETYFSDDEEDENFQDDYMSTDPKGMASNISVMSAYDNMLFSSIDVYGLDRFSVEEKYQIDLIILLRKLKAPLIAHHIILKWARRASQDKFDFNKSILHRRTFVDSLYKKTNMESIKPQLENLILPSSGTSIPMVYHHAPSMLANLLSCPETMQDANLLFHNNDPFAPPPDRINELSDINSGQCYLKSFHEHVTEEYDVLLLTPLHSDKTTIDSDGRCSMHPFNFTIGILNRATRNLHTSWRPLGYLYTTHIEDKKKASKEHDIHVSDSCRRLQDYHAQYKFLLEKSGFLNLQRSGFKWILQFKGQSIPVQFKLVVPHIITDSEEHDRLCCHYTARFQQIKQLCRICECPTKQLDYSKVPVKYRLYHKIKKLVQNREHGRLKAMSQQVCFNGFDEVIFGSHNQRGIFGACPAEILHMIYLGTLKYINEGFFDQIGRSSRAGVAFTELTIQIGELLARQSDRDKPRTNFPKGFSNNTNLKGHEVPGIILILLFAINMDAHNTIFGSKTFCRKGGMGHPNVQTEWIILLECLLQWNEWLHQEMISITEVNKSQRAVQWLMRQMKYVSPRNSGMQWKLIKFHFMVHLKQDILDHGVPQNINSGPTETNHKKTSKNQLTILK